MGKWRLAVAPLMGVLAAWLVSVPGMADDLIEPFALATEEAETEIVSPAHRVLLSPVREVNDEIRSESVARVPVSGIGQLLQVDVDSSRREAREYYLAELRALDANILFECEGRSCGRSNVWANQIFGQALLYGRDSNQDYLAAAVQQDEANYLVLVYTVMRGNMREYVWVEQLELGEGALVPGLDTMSGRIRGPIVVPWSGGLTFRFEWNANDRRQLNDWADSQDAAVVLTSHTELRPEETLEASFERASKAADAMSLLLQKSGISTEQQTSIIVGPSVVNGDAARTGDRIEIVVISAP